MNDRTARLAALFLVAVVSSSVQAQEGERSRPRLAANADTNDWNAYYDAGAAWLDRDPKKAADAFHWAGKLDPTRPEPFYGQRVAYLVQDRRRLLRYWRGEKSVVGSREIRRIDSLYLHALTLNPFFYHRLDSHILEGVIRQIAEGLSEETGLTATELMYWLDRSVADGHVSLRAWVAYSAGDFDRAERLYGEAIRSARRGRAKASLLIDRARLYFQRDKGEKALSDLTAALQELRKADSKDLIYVYESKALAEQSVGMILNRLGQTAAAREAYGRSLQEDLSFFPAHVQLAMLALDAKDTTTALSEMDLAVQIKPDDAGLRYMYGFTLSEVGRSAEAAEQLRKAIELNPVFAAPRMALGKALEADGKQQEALAQYRDFLRLATRNDTRRPEAQARVTALAGGAQ